MISSTPPASMMTKRNKPGFIDDATPNRTARFLDLDATPNRSEEPDMARCAHCARTDDIEVLRDKA